MKRISAAVLLALLAGCNPAPPPDAAMRARVEAACAANPACGPARAQAATDAANQQKLATAQQQINQRAQAERTAAATTAEDKALEQMRTTGFLTSMDGGTRSIAGAARIYVNGELWSGFRATEKEDIVRFFAQYRDAHERLPQVTLYDDHSGHELASFGVFSGVTLK